MRKLLVVFAGMVLGGMFAAFILAGLGIPIGSLTYWTFVVITEILVGRELARLLS